MHRIGDSRVAVTEAHNDRTTGRVQIAVAAGILYPGPVAPNGNYGLADHATEHATHVRYAPARSSARTAPSSASVGGGVSRTEAGTARSQPHAARIV